MFAPIHGSAPDITGKGIANPFAAIWSGSQMFDFFGYEDIALWILNAIEKVLEEKLVLTPDLGGNLSASVGNRVVEKVK